MGDVVLYTWDWREQPPMTEIAKKVRELSHGHIIISQVDTQSDEYMIAIADRPLSSDEALAIRDAELDRM